MGTVSLRATIEGRELTDPMLEVPGHMVFLLPLRPREGLLKEVVMPTQAGGSYQFDIQRSPTPSSKHLVY